MSRINDRTYHEARARDELRLAENATDPGVAAAHRELAALHKRRMMEIVHLGEPQLPSDPMVGRRAPRADLS